MPRPRKHNPSIPSHIDQACLPTGIYWDRSGKGRWYVLEHPRKAVTVAGPRAMLSELHAIMEARAGTALRGTVGFVLERFHDSTEFNALADGTKKGYDHQHRLVKQYRTNLGSTLDTLLVARLTPASIQRIIEAIASGKPGQPGHPTKANHLLRYLRRTFAWGVRMGHCASNPAAGVKQARERKQFRMPTPEAFAAVRNFAAERGNRVAHSAGSVAPYLAPVMTIAYHCRLRGIEVVTLTDAHATPDGIRSNRRKGSRDNVTAWSPELRAAWTALVELRRQAIERHALATQVRPEDRFLIVSEAGKRLSKSSLDSAWQRLMALVLKGDDKGAPVLHEDDYFTLHGLKHRGITDSEDKGSGGHRSEQMRQRYDHSLPVVQPAKLPQK